MAVYVVLRGFQFATSLEVRKKLRKHIPVAFGSFEISRYEAGTEISSGELPKDVLETVLSAANPILALKEDATDGPQE